MRAHVLFLAVTMLTALFSSAYAQTDDWHRLNYKPHSVIPNLSFLNEKPAGARGAVLADGDALVFEDGTPVRFWGANIQASAIFQTRPLAIQAQARRLASLGFNLVRITHHDSHWVNPNVFADQNRTTRELNQNALRIIDRWVEALKAEGIYIWLDIHVGRQMVHRDDIAHFSEIADENGRADIRGYNFISDSIRKRMLEFQRAYTTRRNELSGLRYIDDPAIVGVTISNENDITNHFGNRLLPDKNVPAHNKIYMALADTFAEQHALDPNRVWRSWEAGPSKIFLNDLEQQFYRLFVTDLRARGYKGLISSTSAWGGNPIFSLPALTVGSVIDVHAYEAENELTRSPFHHASALAYPAAVQVIGMPLLISEWNTSNYPQDDRFIFPLRMATLAAHQGWDAPMIYGYAQQPLNGPQRPRTWSVGGDPSVMSTLPASALLYRQGHVQQANKTFALRISPDRFFEERIGPNTSLAIRTIFEQSALVVELPEVEQLPWLQPRTADSSAIPITDLNQSFLDPEATFVEADTGQFRRDFQAGIFTVSTPLSQLAAGDLAGEILDLGDIRVQVDQSMATVAVQSLDGEVISASSDLLITAAARMRPVDRRDPIYVVEPLSGRIVIDAKPGLELTTLKGEPLAFESNDGKYSVDLSVVPDEPWMRLSLP